MNKGNTWGGRVRESVHLFRIDIVRALRAYGIPVPDSKQVCIELSDSDNQCGECFRSIHMDVYGLNVSWDGQEDLEGGAAEESPEPPGFEWTEYPAERTDMGDRVKRFRNGTKENGYAYRHEYLFRTTVYAAIAKENGMGTPWRHTPASGKTFCAVWLTEREHAKVKKLATERARRKSKSKGGK